ncbi:peptidoglycan-binding domain-containing protein [Priestia flexa]|uniref:peptidoglycan-binding domain-containing protein n=1 Tax=Priestia flexa TaxID=86664 RepID=UPI003D7E787D
MGVFKSGCTNRVAIKQIQNALNVVNFKCGIIAGIYVAKTKSAIIRFQKVYLPYAIDGIYGPDIKTKSQAISKSKGY